MSIISVKNLVHRYAKRDEYGEKIGSIPAVDGVSIDVKRGDFISVLGRNGSGKSTLAKHINALLFPSEGKVYVCGYDTEQEEYLLEVRKSAGMVFQNPDNQIIATVVEEDVAFGPENLGTEPAEIQKRVKDCLESVGMYAYREHSPNRLSGGQKQRVAIAGVLAMKPACIILDEPTAMLDPIGRKEVLRVVHKLNKEEKITVILVTHHMDEVIGSDRLFVMDKGRVVLQGTPKEVFERADEIRSLGLDMPQVTETALRLRKMGYAIPTVLTVEEFADEFEALAAERASDTVGAALNDKKIQNTVREEDPKKDRIGSKTENLLKDKTDKEEILSIKNLSYVYSPNTAMEQRAVNNISLTVRKGEYIAIIGHTGSGKSTLIQQLNALEKPSSGSVFFKGEDIYSEGYDRRLLRGKVGLAFQYPDHQLFEATVYKDVAFGPKNQGLTAEESDKRVKDALELVGISEEKWQESPFDLSGGEKKRVAIAGVLAMKPEVLILDEPTAGLDPAGRDEILGQINSIYEKTGITVILVSHSMEDVARFAKRIIVLNDGETVLDGTPENVFKNQEQLESIGLSVPQSTALINLLKARGYEIKGDAINVSQCVKLLADFLGRF